MQAQAMATTSGTHQEVPAAASDAPAPRTVAEPATARALWPTFMRRTLAEDALRAESRPRAEQPAPA
jgi:hypothetical protein